ncbi:response regulator [Zobellella sp. An-6]|uniref:response regulator n=1 Tax=Zobellella sp. An-6 TaxID=3400218 RepID=UPI0040426641
MPTRTLLLIDDHAMFRTGLGLILSSHPDLGLLSEAGSVQEALALHEAELILLDIGLPGINGLDGILLLQQRFPRAAILMLSASDDPAHVQHARHKGARGFISKAADAETIVQAISALVRGERYFPGLEPTAPPFEGATLTARQLEVLSLLCEGKSNKAIARILGAAENTVRVHVSAILAVLRVSSRTEAVVAARARGIIR